MELRDWVLVIGAGVSICQLGLALVVLVRTAGNVRRAAELAMEGRMPAYQLVVTQDGDGLCAQILNLGGSPLWARWGRDTSRRTPVSVGQERLLSLEDVRADLSELEVSDQFGAIVHRYACDRRRLGRDGHLEIDPPKRTYVLD